MAFSLGVLDRQLWQLVTYSTSAAIGIIIGRPT